MIYTFRTSIYLRASLVFKKYLYSFFRVWKCSKDGLFIYLFSVDIVNVIFNYILVFIYMSFLIAIWNFFIFFLDVCFRFLMSCVVFIDIGEGLEYLVKLAFCRI